MTNLKTLNGSELFVLPEKILCQADNLVINKEVTRDNKKKFEKTNATFKNVESLTFNKVIDSLPGWFHLNHLDKLGILLMSKSMENDLNVSSIEAVKLGVDFLRDIIHPAIEGIVVPRLIKQREKNDENSILSFVQMIRMNKKVKYRPYFTATKISKKYHCFICQSIPFINFENEIHKYSDKIDLHLEQIADFQRYRSLTKREKEILRLISLGETNNEISELLNISPLTVKTHRQNLIRKLGANKLSQLVRIARNFKLV